MFSPWSDPLQFPAGAPQQTHFNFADKAMRCVGCGSESSIRVHYGAASCHGCKAFFRRSVFENRTYECSSRNTCDVTPMYRNRCRSCRFRNCVNGGMNTKLVREERFKSAASRSTSRQPSVSGNSPKSETEFGAHAIIKQETFEEECNYVQFLVDLDRKMDMLQGTSQIHHADEDWARNLFFNLGLGDNQYIIQRTAMNWDCSRIMSSADMYFGWYRAFILLADWAMNIPEFKLLSIGDQTTLFKENFSAFAWMTYAYRSYECGNSQMGIPLGNGAYIPYQRQQQAMMDPRWASSYGIVVKYVVECIVNTMQDVSMCFEEYCLLKILALFQQDCRLSDQSAVLCAQVRDKCLRALNVVIDNKFPHLTASQRVMRVSREMLMLPSFYNIGRMEAEMLRNMNNQDINKASGVPLVILNNFKNGGGTNYNM